MNQLFTWAWQLWREAGLWCAALIFLWPLRRRENFRLRLILGLAGGFLLHLAVGLLPITSGSGLWLYFLVSFLLANGFFALCADISRSAVVYCAVWTMVLYHLSCSLGLSLVRALEWCPPAGNLCAALAVTVLMAASALTLARWMPVKGTYQVGPRQLSLSLILLLLILLLVQLSSTLWYGENLPALWLFPLLIEFYCGTLLYLQHELFKKSYIRQELDTLNQLWMQQKAQYALARKNIMLINRKCHELKHQIRAMRAMVGDEKVVYLKELEKSVRIYDAIAKTGNEVLDTVLTEKSLYCEANHIQAHCIADGSLLDFMDPVDLYTLFANALDNAIEHVQTIQDPDKRIIDVLVYAENKLLAIQVSNPVARDIRFGADGLPLSTKASADGCHGFGLKSIRHAVEKYNGFLTVKVEDGCFHLRILLPMRSA